MELASSFFEDESPDWMQPFYWWVMLLLLQAQNDVLVVGELMEECVVETDYLGLVGEVVFLPLLVSSFLLDGNQNIEYEANGHHFHLHCL